MSTIYDRVTYTRQGPRYHASPGSRPSAAALEVQALVERTERAYARHGLPMAPVVVVQDGQPGAAAWPSNLEVHTGWPNPLALPVVLAHEQSHFERGDVASTALPTFQEELRADWGAGFRAAQLEMPKEVIDAALDTFRLQADSPTHNSASTRRAAFRLGMKAFGEGKAFVTGGDAFLVDAFG